METTGMKKTSSKNEPVVQTKRKINTKDVTGNRGGGKGGERKREIKKDVLSEKERGKYSKWFTMFIKL